MSNGQRGRRRRKINWFGIVFWLLIMVILTCAVLLIVNSRSSGDTAEDPDPEYTQQDTPDVPDNTTSDETQDEITEDTQDTSNDEKTDEESEKPADDTREETGNETEEDTEEKEEETETEEESEDEQQEETPPPPSAGVEDPENYDSKSALVAATAVSAIGTAEEYGGSGPDSFDTSGLVYFCFTESGVTAPRSFSEQAAYGTEVEREDVRPGDVVFFYNENEGEAEYVGIYIGDGKFVAVSSSREQVCEMNFESEYYTNRFVFARRYCE